APEPTQRAPFSPGGKGPGMRGALSLLRTSRSVFRQDWPTTFFPRYDRDFESPSKAPPNAALPRYFTTDRNHGAAARQGDGVSVGYRAGFPVDPALHDRGSL